MFLRTLLLFAYFIFWNIGFAQENSILHISPQLKENANAVVLSSVTEVNITSRKAMTVKKTRKVTVLNENGLSYIDASEYYDNATSIKSLEAVIYDMTGNQIKKFRKKDFTDHSVSDGFSVASDNRILSLDYTPVQYPFTVLYTSEVATSNTAFISPWVPVEGYYVATGHTAFTIKYPADLGFRYKEYNVGNTKVVKSESPGSLSLSAENLTAIKPEDYSPAFQSAMPYVMFALSKFNLEGVDGNVTDWKSFGSWIYGSLLAGTDELPQATKQEVKTLIGNETDPIKKARIVYEYVQRKTRYISIQLGIGGWKPMLAKDVDRLGYGDCKALTNYTRALLKAVDVEAYYTIVYAGKGKRDIKPDFVSMQGNHVILAIPNNDKITWLECTSQVSPFGFQGDFTDDRMALMVMPDKGELVRTTVYDPKINKQVLKGSYKITPAGTLAGNMQITSYGLQYDNKMHLGSSSKEDIEKYYRDGLSYIHNIKLRKADISNNKDNQNLVENIALEGDGYWSAVGDKFMFPINAFNKSRHIPQRYRDRKLPFVIERGFYDTDEVTIDLPQGYSIDAKPENVVLSGKFGEYKMEYDYSQPGKIIYTRSLLVNNGSFASEEYENYRQFREKIARNDNAKIMLLKN